MEEDLKLYGTPLEPLEEDDIPSKKPIQVQDQIVTDEHGRRRFHGAFTGGFSAGFWNSVGSLEGWKPQYFKSSRSEKAPKRKEQRPEDFMDQEDLGEFGIAPQGLKTKEDFAHTSENRKRKFLPNNSTGPIPGTPVLEQFLRPIKDKVAVRILKSMGWRPGQGIGPRLTRKEKKLAKKHNERELYLMQHYGCEIKESMAKNTLSKSSSHSEDDESDENDITFAPDDFDSVYCSSKTNRFGLGYTGLSHEPVLSEGKRTESSSIIQNNSMNVLEILGKGNKKFSITGQAFGVGALEEDDDYDIYQRDDLSKYDFSLEDKKPLKKKQELHIQDSIIIEGFVASKNKNQYIVPYTVQLPANYQPRNWLERRSRFEPLDPQRAENITVSTQNNKFKINIDKRAEILGEIGVPKMHSTTNSSLNLSIQTSAQEIQDKNKNREDRAKKLLDTILAKSRNFEKGGIISEEGEETLSNIKTISVDNGVHKENKDLIDKARSKTKNLGTSATSGEFKPFINDDSKQSRYESFLASNLTDEKEIEIFLSRVQPVEMSLWDREMEKKEFIQASKLYKPLQGLMSERFVSEAVVVEDKKVENQTKEDKEVTIERMNTTWIPNSLLCKRFNIPEPFGGSLAEDVKPIRNKISVFDYIEMSTNSKSNFQTPVIIPKKIEKVETVVPNLRESSNTSNRKEKSTSIASLPDEECDKTVVKSIDKNPIRSSKVVKSVLEKRIEESVDRRPSEKVELYKAIFSDSDDDEKKEKDSENKVIPPSTKSFDFQTSISAASVNLLRNTSPPRGIFAALNAPMSKEVPKVTSIINPQDPKPIGRISFTSKKERLPKSESEELPESFYGPKPPPNKIKQNDEDIDQQLLSVLKNNSKLEISKDNWVEKILTVSGSSDDSNDSDSVSISSSSSDNRSKRKKNKSKKIKKSDTKDNKKKKKKKENKKSKKHEKRSKKSKKAKH